MHNKLVANGKTIAIPPTLKKYLVMSTDTIYGRFVKKNRPNSHIIMCSIG